MSAIQERMLDAISILSQNAVLQSNATITIECEIYEQTDPGIGLYKVKYLENIINAYSNPNSTYQNGDIVFVLVPDGDLTKTLTIIGAVSPSASTYITNEASNSYVIISDNLFTSINDNETIELCTYKSERRNIDLDVTNFNMIFSDYLKNYNTYVFTARVKTNMPLEQQQSGNYGLILNLPFLEDAGDGTGSVETYKAISIDVNTMQGNPYRFNEYALQNVYFEVANGVSYDTSRNPYITVFVQDFAQDESITAADIWITDIGLKVVNVLSEEDKQGYSLTLVASEGNYFLNEKYSATKILKPILKINGKNKDVKDYECYWFVEDASIGIEDDGYFKLGGLGWECLNKKTNVNYNEEGKQTYQYVTNLYEYSVPNSRVFSTLRYKCVITKDDIVVSGIVCLKNLNNNIQIELVSATGSPTFVKDTGYVDLIARIYYPGVSDNTSSSTSIKTAWQRFDRNDNYLDDDFYEYIKINDRVSIVDKTGTKTWLETEIKYPCSLVEDSNIIKCTFYGIVINNGTIAENNLGTVSIIVNTSDNFVYKLMIQNGDVLYKYDADGDSPMIADYDGPASSKVTEIQPLSYKLYKEDGTELNDTEYQYCEAEWKIPKNSMIKLKTSSTSSDDNYYYITGKGKFDINYSIVDIYNVKKNNNNVVLTVNFRDNIITENVNIKFLKDGESGTNGSKYTGIITYQGYGYEEINSNGKPHKLHPVLVNSTWKLCDSSTGTLTSWSSPTLKVSVYCDGTLLTTGYSVLWSIFDNSVTKPLFAISSSGVLSYLGSSWSDDTSTIIEAKITVGNSGVTNSQEVIYAYYPIEITYLPNSNYESGVIPNLINGFSKVLYAADGTNPQYDNTNPFTYADNLNDADASSYYNYSWSVGGNLTIKSTNYNTCTIKPYTKFDNGNSKNYVNILMQITSSGRSQVNNLINQLSTKVSNLTNEITYNQYTLQNILAFSGKFSYNNYVGLLDNSKNLLYYRSNLIYYIDQLKNILNDLYNYCNLKLSLSDFDYNIIIDRLNILDAENENLYKLGYYLKLNNLSRLSDEKIILDNAEDIKNKYGISIYEVINSYIVKFNDILEKKYWVSYDKLCEVNGTDYVLINEFNKFKELETSLIGLYNDTNLIWLQNSHYGFGPEREFINLRNQLTAIVNKLFSTTQNCYSYDAINKEVLKEYQNYIGQYKNDYYIKSYNNKIAALQVELEESNIELADYRKVITSQTSGTIKHSKPIVMIYNRYELSNINGWDGNKLYIDSNNNQYLLAPQVGAGAKQNGLFTGVVMGIKQFNNSSTQHIGLFGYASGVQSYFMNAEDGSIIMGKSGSGQIIADPSSSKALLYSSNFFNNYGNDGKPTSYGTTNWAKKGLLIDLTTPQIQFGSGKFSVSSEGEIKSTSGLIGGWKIDSTQIYSNVSESNGRLTLDSGASVSGTDSQGNPTYSYSYGKIYSGNHSSLSSTYKGFYLSNDGLSISDSSSNNRIELSTTGTPVIYSNGHSSISSTNKGFYLSNDGLSISDSGSSNRIELNTTGNPKIYSGGHSSLSSTNKGFYLSQDGLSISDSGSSNRIELSTTGNPKLYSGGHSYLSSTSKGFYLSNDGMSISSGTSRFEISTEGSPTIYSGNHSSLNSTYKGFYLGNDGMSISSGTSRFKISTEGSPELYSGSHSSLTSTNSGFYLGNDGLSIGSKVYIDSDGILRLGYGAVNDNYAHWTINGDYYNSYIKYGTQGANNSVYIGTDKITLGATFSVDRTGKLDATNANISGKIEVTNGGKVGGWNITNNELTSGSVYIGPNRIKLGDHFSVDSNGYLTATEANIGGSIEVTNGGKVGGWNIEDGKLSSNWGFEINPYSTETLKGSRGYIDLISDGCHINADNVTFSTNDIRVTEYRGGSSVYGGQSTTINYIRGGSSESGYDYGSLQFLHGILVNAW